MSKNVPNTAIEFFEDFFDASFNEDDEIEEAFYHFPVGTHRFDVFEWMENHYNVKMTDILNSLTQGDYSVDVDITPDNALFSQGEFFIHQSMEANRLEIEVAKLGWITINRTEEGLITDIYPLARGKDNDSALLESALFEEDFHKDLSEETLEATPGPAPHSDDFSQFTSLLDAIKQASLTPEIYEAIEKTSNLNKAQVDAILDAAQERMDNRRILEEDKVIDDKLMKPKIPTP